MPEFPAAARFENEVKNPDKTMSASTLKAAMLWTGGKDSAMALDEALAGGFRVSCLVTFAPPEPKFLAHPLDVIRLQAEAMALPHHLVTVREPYTEGYEAALRMLRQDMGIDCVITGDIAQVDGQPNWIRERARPVGMQVHTPLWSRERELLLQELLGRKFRAVISCVDTRRLAASWVGREMNDDAVAELRELGRTAGVDLCGENGEYHTLVLDGPQFTQAIELPRFSVRTQGSLAYLELRHI